MADLQLAGRPVQFESESDSQFTERVKEFTEKKEKFCNVFDIMKYKVSQNVFVTFTHCHSC